MSAQRVYAAALNEHRNRLARVAERGSVRRLKVLYDQAQDELAAKIKRAVPARKKEFTVMAQRHVLAQVRDGQAEIAARMAGELGDASREAQVEALQGTASWIAGTEKAATGLDLTLPIDEASRFWGVIDGRRQSLARAHAESMASYGSRLVGAIEDQLALSLVQGESTEAAIDRVQGTAENEWWQAERIVRTEVSAAYNQTAADGIAEVAREVDDLRIRWTEHVSDDGAPLDARVGADSIALHAQVARIGEGWIMPPDAEDVSEEMLGRRFYSAPARPNGREVLSPWRPSWGISGWEWRGGRVVWLVT